MNRYVFKALNTTRVFAIGAAWTIAMLAAATFIAIWPSSQENATLEAGPFNIEFDPGQAQPESQNLLTSELQKLVCSVTPYAGQDVAGESPSVSARGEMRGARPHILICECVPSEARSGICRERVLDVLTSHAPADINAAAWRTTYSHDISLSSMGVVENLTRTMLLIAAFSVLFLPMLWMHQWREDFSWVRSHPGTVLGCMVALFALASTSIIWFETTGAFFYNESPIDTGSSHGDGPGFRTMVAVTFLVIIATLLVSTGEELIFRGYLQTELPKYIGLPAAMILLNLFFGVIHTANSVVFFDEFTMLKSSWIWLHIAILGLGFSLVRHFTGSLVTVIIFHCVYNMFVFGARLAF
ncbi:MAG: CPBP family intramembrane metalloprotease [Aquimonas sp.]|nr:CPBP family intramembrane metalloprotease [Aquimonas sp.]